MTTNVAEVLRLRAIKLLVCDRSARRCAQDDGFVVDDGVVGDDGVVEDDGFVEGSRFFEGMTVLW
jgi:hypothetical protein